MPYRDKEQKTKYMREYYQRNKEKLAEQHHKNYEENKEHKAEYNRQYGELHKLDKAEYNRRYAEENKERILKQKREYYLANFEQIAKRTKLRHERLREEDKKRREQRKERVLIYYGNGKLACVRCGFTDIRALSIDHIKGWGTEHRRLLKTKNGQMFYRWLIDNSYPEGYQTLCMNCQWIKRRENNEERWRQKE